MQHKDAYSLAQLSGVVARVRGGEAGVTAPHLHAATQQPLPDRTLAHRPDVLIVEGRYVLCHAGLAGMADVKVPRARPPRGATG